MVLHHRHPFPRHRSPHRAEARLYGIGMEARLKPVNFICDGISYAYMCPTGVLSSRPDMWREADTAGGCRWSAGIFNLLAVHSAEEVIASTTTCNDPYCLEMKEQVRSATRPASLHIHLFISSDVYEPYNYTYIHTYSTHRPFAIFNDFWNT